MRGDERSEYRGETLHTPLPLIPNRLKQSRVTSEDTDGLQPLDRNGIIMSDPSGLDQEFYDPQVSQQPTAEQGDTR